MAEMNSQDHDLLIKIDTDHDLLIKIDTKLERVITDVSDLKTNLSGDVENLKIDHVGRDEFEKLTNWRWYIAGGIVVVVAVLTIFIIPSYKEIQQEQKDINTRLNTIEITLDNKK